MTAILCVTATVDPAVRDEFDHWYATDHIPAARRLLVGIRDVTRWRSMTTPNQVSTVYRFEDEEQLRAALEGAAIKSLIADFDRLWSGKVVRERSGHVLIYQASE